jgi:diguanylate cyclase (GGDEF)-like protein
MPASTGSTILPLRVGEVALGAIYLDRALAREDDADLLTIFANQAAVAVHNATLYDFAAVDPLTRTYTRRFFEHALVRELRLASRSAQPLAVIMVDMDDLRVLNNEGGHLCGDRALETVGRLLKAGTRATDLVGRWGGDEFVVVLPSTDAAGAAVVTERIVRMSRELEVNAGERCFDVRVSIGSTVLAGAHDDQAPRSHRDYDKAAMALISRADAALYTAKRAAKGNAHAGPTEGWPSPTPDTERRPDEGGNGFGFSLLDRS